MVRIHSPDSTYQPLGVLPGINWTRHWKEVEVYSRLMFEGDKLMYYFSNTRHLPNPMLNDFNIEILSLPWSKPMEVNLWMGTPTW